MTPEEALLAATPSWLKDGRGLFPDPYVNPFGPGEPARVIRTEAPPFDLMDIPGLKNGPPPPILPPSCPVSGTITLTVSGIIAVACVSDGASGSFSVSSFSGLNGMFTLTWDGLSSFAISGVGAWEIDHYTDPTCGTSDTGGTGTFDITASCLDGAWTVAIKCSGAGGLVPVVFSTGTPQPFGSNIPNTLSSATNVFGDGTANVTP